jgi:hypothetical protein
MKAFIIDYIERHKHPGNAILHIFGVPLAFWGIFVVIGGLFSAVPGKTLLLGVVAIVAGYFLQWLGHRLQGNEVGEVTLIKHIFARLQQGRKHV